MAIHLLQQTYIDSLLNPMNLDQLAQDPIMQVRLETKQQYSVGIVPRTHTRHTAPPH